MIFLYILFVIGLIIATFQDFKRREIDDWLNYSLFVIGSFFLLFSSFLSDRTFDIANYGFFVFLMFILAISFYNAKVFAGGDAKLLFAMSPILFDIFFLKGLSNLILYLFIFFLVGGFYGLFYAVYMSTKNFKRFKKNFKNELSKFNLKSILCGCFVLFFFGFFYKFFFLLFLFCVIFLFLFAFAKAVDNGFMVRLVNVRELKEGDWLVNNVKFRKRVIYVKWEGIGKKDINFLKNYSKKILIREGVPFGVVFLISFILYLLNIYLNFFRLF